MTVHIMTDIESLSTRPGAIVLSAAFVRFTDEACMSINLSVPDQQMLGLEQDPSTLEWWRDQEAKQPGTWQRSTENALPLATALPYIASWIEWARGGDSFQIWCHGATFDCPLLDEVFRRAGYASPWAFWQVRDTRTLYDLALINPKEYPVPPPHVALNDAISQTRAANAALAILARAHQQPQAIVALPTRIGGVDRCSVCGDPQFHTTHGTTCKNGHGGAAAMSELRAEMDRSIPF